uniref:Uncharacterized protein n=1 Tax=Globodera rostochiensis TaxID=31243 RepID=A0A914HGN9_GLORO
MGGTEAVVERVRQQRVRRSVHYVCQNFALIPSAVRRRNSIFEPLFDVTQAGFSLFVHVDYGDAQSSH